MTTATRELRLVRPVPVTRRHATRLVRFGWWIVLFALVPLGLWISLAPLSMAVVAPAVVTVDLNRRPVQHLEGGIVRAVLVRDGQRVKAGAPILILGDVGVDADRNRLRYRVSLERAALARHEAEQLLAPALVFPQELVEAGERDLRIQQALAKEAALFGARRESLNSEVGLMRRQRERVQQEVAALEAQIRQGQNALAMQERDLEANRQLLTEGLIAPIRVWQVEAMVLDYASKLEERRSELARSEQRLVDVDLRIQTIQNEYVRAASDQLKGTAARLGEIEQELRKSEDAATRQVVAAPAGGEIIDLRFTSPGAVVRPGEPIAEIVPSDARLMIEARIRPEEINHVHRGQRARIRFTAYKYRSALLVNGAVTYVSADRLLDRANNFPYYSVTILADPESLQASGNLTLQAGMPAEVYIEGATQTPLQYLLEPITSTLRRAAREL
jgi:HlyD family secretion protein